jgi:ubiquinone/menaquinone biosynthesis C-methylase UbiE
MLISTGDQRGGTAMTTPAPTRDQVRDAWDALAPGFDEFTTPMTRRLAERLLGDAVQPGTRLLDLAAGSGAVGLVAARRGAEVVAVDIAPRMIEALAARARAETLSNIEGRVMDGLALDLDDDSFDVCVSLNGVSLFPDLARGLFEAVRVTRPGGRVIIGAFGPLPKAEFIAFTMGAMQAAVPGFTLPEGPLPPFRWADPEVFRRHLVGAGLTGVSVETVTGDTPFESVDHLWNTFRSSNPIGAKLVGSLSPEQQVQVRQVLDGMLRERSGGRAGATLHAEVNVGRGTK